MTCALASPVVVVVSSRFRVGHVVKNGGTGERRDQMKGEGFGTCIAMIQPVSGQLNALPVVPACASAEDTVRMTKIL